MVYRYMFGATDNHIIYDRCDCRIKKEQTMNLPDALLNAKKYIHEPKYHEKERMWGYDRRVNGQWVTYFTITEEACWEAFYKQFRAIKESLMVTNERGK